MLENWCWHPSVLKFLSRKWDSGETIPDDMLEKLIKTKHFNSASTNLRQLLYGIFDMTIHTPKSHQEAEDMPIAKIWNDLRREITGLKGLEERGEKGDHDHRYAGVGHFVGGYDAGYYGYLYSEVFSLDMFHSFFQMDPMNAKEGRRYRELVLQRGGSQPELQTLRDFLGRDPSSESFYRELGLN
ncbi:hypothetical protein E4U31_006901 [Claviceps sp. LM219 group G6]|nr:hypothetical protein E4U31_006901 [Claviceps sp. LM219 group G6]